MLWPHLLHPWRTAALPPPEDEPDTPSADTLPPIRAEHWADSPYRFSIHFAGQIPPAQAPAWTLELSNPGGGILHLAFQAQHLLALHVLVLPPPAEDELSAGSHTATCRQLFCPPAFALMPYQGGSGGLTCPPAQLVAGPTLCQTLPWRWEVGDYQVVVSFPDLTPAARIALGDGDVLVTEDRALAGWVFGGAVGQALSALRP